MSEVKEAVIKLVQALPEDCTLEDIRYHLYVRAKVEAGMRAIEAGDVVSQEEAERRIDEWLQ
jgi:predicted transcriptional regulator